MITSEYSTMIFLVLSLSSFNYECLSIYKGKIVEMLSGNKEDHCIWKRKLDLQYNFKALRLQFKPLNFGQFAFTR